MGSNVYEETMVEKNVTYILELDGEFIVIENVPPGFLRRQESASSHQKRWSACNRLPANERAPADSLRLQCSSLHA